MIAANTLIKTTVRNKCFLYSILLCTTYNKIEHKKHLLRTVVLIKVLVDTHATGCKTQQLI
jgi:hypothetical protein